MSKSYNNHIELFGDAKELKARIMRIVTDSTPLDKPKDPSKCNVVALYRLFASPDEMSAMEQRYRKGGYGYGDAKKALVDAVTRNLAPFAAKRRELAADPAYVESVLTRGAARARAEARSTLNAARKAMGID
jgi:tryptophanyl-tRNA synthetase